MCHVFHLMSQKFEDVRSDIGGGGWVLCCLGRLCFVGQ